MKELYVEEIANHNGHESCADDREVVREAFDSGIYRLGIEKKLEQQQQQHNWTNLND